MRIRRVVTHRDNQQQHIYSANFWSRFVIYMYVFQLVVRRPRLVGYAFREFSHPACRSANPWITSGSRCASERERTAVNYNTVFGEWGGRKGRETFASRSIETAPIYTLYLYRCVCENFASAKGRNGLLDFKMRATRGPPCKTGGGGFLHCWFPRTYVYNCEQSFLARINRFSLSSFSHLFWQWLPFSNISVWEGIKFSCEKSLPIIYQQTENYQMFYGSNMGSWMLGWQRLFVIFFFYTFSERVVNWNVIEFSKLSWWSWIKAVWIFY